MNNFLKTASAVLMFFSLWGCGQPQESASKSATPTEPAPTLTVADAEAIYDYAYPLVIMKISQDMMFSVPFRPASHANHFIHFKRLAMPQNRAVVLGNRNTLYSVGWVDLSKGPVRFEIPDMGARYYVMPLLDAWTNTFRSLGSRTTGQDAQKYLLVNNTWQGEAPAEYEVIVCPTNMVWITGRIQADNPEDAVAASIVQSAYQLQTDQEALGNGDPFEGFVPTFKAMEVKKPVPFSLQMSPQTFYDQFLVQWASNASPQQDAPMLALLAKAGLQTGLSYTSLPVATQQVLAEGMTNKQKGYLTAFYQGDKQEAAWTFNREQMGTWGTDYQRRAYWAMWGLGANLVEDAVYGVSQLDATMQPLDGGSTYKLHFAADDIPPTNAFWSVTTYDKEGYLEANELHRYSLGSNHKLNHNSDGSVDLYLSNKRPANENTNWVPSPKAHFKVLLRIYWPKAEALNGSWELPPLEKEEKVE